MDLLLANGCVYQNGLFEETNLLVSGKSIKKVTNETIEHAKIIDCSGKYICPGIIDPHVHFQLDLGKITSRDDFYSGSVSGIYGGVTTFIDFLEPVDNERDLVIALEKRKKEARKSQSDYAFHACLKQPNCDLEVFVKTMIENHITSLKVFTTYKDSNRNTSDEDIYQLLRLSNQYRFTLLVHAENDDDITISPTDEYFDLPKSRPSKSELNQVLKLAKMVKETKGYLYLVHITSGDTVEALKKEYQELLNQHIFIESCPQYFTFDDSILFSEKGYLYTCAPPLRPIQELMKLTEHIEDIYSIGTDHCSFHQSDKKGKLLKDIPLGLPGIEHSFPLMMQKFSTLVIDKMTIHPATIFHLPNKGKIEEGYDADLVIFDQIPGFITQNHAKSDYYLYQGLPISIRIHSVMIRGEFVYQFECISSKEGKYLERSIL